MGLFQQSRVIIMPPIVLQMLPASQSPDKHVRIDAPLNSYCQSLRMEMLEKTTANLSWIQSQLLLICKFFQSLHFLKAIKENQGLTQLDISVTN